MYLLLLYYTQSCVRKQGKYTQNSKMMEHNYRETKWERSVMEVKVLKVGEELLEVVEIRCHRINAQVNEIVAF